MTPAVEQLVRETIELTGAEGPALLADDAPVLSDDALAPSDDTDGDDFYLVGLIGGKDVGKSALVNALAGRSITAITSHGAGTEVVVAYVHTSREAALRDLLEREVPGKYRIVTHELPDLTRQILLDLPDIDSHWQSHPMVTRAMLRHMLYPVWVQSVEKYADLQPQQMLAKVAAGNDVRNFVFCLNKVDQLEGSRLRVQGSGGDGAAQELREDFGARIARTVGLKETPPVFLVSAKQPERYELPQLRTMLARQKSEQDVRQSKELAGRRQDHSLIAWLGQQQLPARAERLARLHRDAEEMLAARVGESLLEEAIPALIDDPANRLALADEVLRERVTRWPLVNLVHTLLAPLLAVWRSNVGAAGRTNLRGADALVEAYLHDDGGRGIAARVQSTFAQIRQSQPLVAELYRHNKLWEDMPADIAEGELRRALAATIERQRAAARQRLAGRGGVIAPLFRWLLTIGALLWFPIVQPVLEVFLREGGLSPRRLLELLVSVLSGAHLLKNVSFLLLWFLIIWLALRWNTQRRVTRLLARWKSSDEPDPSLNLTAQALQWMAGLVDPIRRNHERIASLAERAERLRAPAAAA